MGQRERAGAPECMAGQAGHRRIWEIEDGVQHRIEAVRVGEGIGVALIELETGAEELGAGRGCQYGAGRGRAKSALDVVEGSYDFAAEGAAEAVFRRRGKSYDEDVA